MDGPATLEYWLEESITTPMDPELEEKLVQHLEPYRTIIELRLDAYDEEKNGSWRDYRNALMFVLHPDDEEKVDAIIAEHVEGKKVRFLTRVMEEAVDKKAKAAAEIIARICKEELGERAATKSISHLRVAVAKRYGANTGDLPKQIPSLIRWAIAEERTFRQERYQVILDAIPHGQMVHIDNIYDALYDTTEKGKLEEQEQDMLDRLHAAMDDQLVFADGDLYGRMYWACLQADEAIAEMGCGCVLHRLSTGAVVLQMCKVHLAAVQV
jgi:hypothetical protein